MNEEDIIVALEEHGPANSVELSKSTGLSISDVGKAILRLKERGEIVFAAGKLHLADNAQTKTEPPVTQDEGGLPESPVANTASGDPEEDLDAKKAQVIEVLKAAPTRLSSYKIIDKIGYTGGRERAARRFRKILDRWVDSGDLKRDGSFHFWVPGYEKNHPTIGNIASGKVPSFGKKIVPAETVSPKTDDYNKNDPLAAIDRMAEKMQRRAIDNLAIKTAVLRKLSPIVDPSIASVLNEIAQDLEAQHGTKMD